MRGKGNWLFAAFATSLLLWAAIAVLAYNVATKLIGG